MQEGGAERNAKFSDSEGVDDHDEVLHNLASLLLTNTTLRSAAGETAGEAEKIFNN